MRGALHKMQVAQADGATVCYRLPLGEELLPLAPLLGARMRMRFTGNIFCMHCARKTKKSFSRGYCFPCSQTLAECDLCIMRPHTCHHHLGTCRDETWAAQTCMQPHCVYLANTSGLKVGITRAGNTLTRWIDQGAAQAVVLFEVQSRLHSGLLEHALAKHLSDRTDWRKMLRAPAAHVDLRAAREKLLAECAQELTALQKRNPGLAWKCAQDSPREFAYPVLQYPQKVTALNFDKQFEIDSRLLGVKGQYLIFESGVLNVRKFGGYEIEMEC